VDPLDLTDHAGTPIQLPVPETLGGVLEALAESGGQGVLVGGYVRDRLLGIDAKDIDVEVYGMSPDLLERVLARFGPVISVGKTFGVFRLKSLDVDFSLPRRDSKVGRGHRGFEIELDPRLSFPEAARRRDFTINAIGFDPRTGRLLDPFGGREDLASRVLRATDPKTFGEDPLRALRAAQFIARFELGPDPELIALCKTLDLAELAPERILEEWRKLLLKGCRPALGLQFLSDAGLIRFFPELDALRGVPQDPAWHPEGDVWRHNLMVLDAAASLRNGEEDDAMMFGALCHDLGKATCTRVDADGRVRSHAHDTAGVALADRFLSRMRASRALTGKVSVLVATHLAPPLLVQQGSSPKAYRRLARKLEDAGANIELLVRVAKADHLGRTTGDALKGIVRWERPFLEHARMSLTSFQAPPPAVRGRHLIDHGLTPGPLFSLILAHCQEIQDDTGLEEPEPILDRVLEAHPEWRPAPDEDHTARSCASHATRPSER